MSKNAKRQLKAVKAARKPREIPLPNTPDLDVEGHLRRILNGSLGGPGGDPDRHHHMAAAHAFLALKLLGHPVKPDDETYLRGDNVFELDFLKVAQKGIAL